MKARDPEGWEQEFYPITAAAAAKRGEVAAAEHSLKKWRGVLPKNLEKYGLKEKPIEFLANTCALCQRHDSKGHSTTAPDPSCRGCSLYEVRGRVSCVDRRPREEWSPFSQFDSLSNPRPMIHWLQKAVKWAKEHAK